MLTMPPSLQTDMGQMTMVLASPIHTVAGRQTWLGQTTAVLPLATTTMERQKRTHMDQVPSVLAMTRTAGITDRQTRPDQMIVRATTARLMIAIMAIPIHTAVVPDRQTRPDQMIVGTTTARLMIAIMAIPIHTAVVTDPTRPDQMIMRTTTARQRRTLSRLMIAILAIPIHTAVATNRLVSPILMRHPVGTIMDLVLTPTTMAHMATGPQTTKAMARRQVKPVKTGSIKALVL